MDSKARDREHASMSCAMEGHTWHWLDEGGSLLRCASSIRHGEADGDHEVGRDDDSDGIWTVASLLWRCAGEPRPQSCVRGQGA